MKALENMASQSSNPDRAIPFAAFAADIERRRRETGVDDLPRNDGARRTASKRALLAAIERAGGKW
jgi:hypothetical protein